MAIPFVSLDDNGGEYLTWKWNTQVTNWMINFCTCIKNILMDTCQRMTTRCTLTIRSSDTLWLGVDRTQRATKSIRSYSELKKKKTAITHRAIAYKCIDQTKMIDTTLWFWFHQLLAVDVAMRYPIQNT